MMLVNYIPLARTFAVMGGGYTLIARGYVVKLIKVTAAAEYTRDSMR